MCGHAVISLGRNAIDHGLVKPVSQCPCGPVTAHVKYDSKKKYDSKTGKQVR